MGLPAFLDYDIGLFFSKGYCTIHGHKVPLIKNLKSQWYSELRSISHTVLAPRSQHVIPVNSALPLATKFAKIIPSKALLSSPLRVPNAISKSNKLNRIIIANPTDSSIEIKPHALLAYAATSHYEEPTISLFDEPKEEIPEHDPDDPTKPLVDDSIYIPTDAGLPNEYTEENFLSDASSCYNTELSQEERNTVEKLLLAFKDLFAKNSKSPGVQTKTKCKVPLKDPNGHPLRFPPYRVTPKVLAEMKTQIQELLDNGIIKKSTSAWAFPVVMVPKSDGTIRFCTDFSKLSDKVEYDPYPLPRIDDTLDRLAGAKYFTTCDAASGYWQIPVEEDDQEKLSIITPFGTYSYLVMPMGYCNSSGIFQRAMNETLDEYLFSCCLVYVDDLIIYSPTFEAHLEDIKKVFIKLRLFGWKLKLSKCKFAHTTVDFLGHSISHNQISIKEDNLKTLLAMKRPTKVKELQSFLGLANYYKKFTQGYSYIITPLLPLLRKNTPWIWTTQHDQAFEEIVSRLAKYPILRMPDFNRPFVVRTDASDFAYGSALVQNYDGIEFPISFHSGSFLPGQRLNWPTWKREGYSIVAAIKKWHHYLVNEKFTIITDHESLLTILDPRKETKAIIIRWRMYLIQFRFTIKHRPGKFLVIEDSLSRSPSLMTLSIKDLKSAQTTDPIILEIISVINGKKEKDISNEVASILRHAHQHFLFEDNTLYFLTHHENQRRLFKRMVIPASTLKELLPIYHDASTSGHHSTERTYEKLAREYWTPNLYSKVKEYCEKCHTCDRNRSFFKHTSNLIPIVAHEPMEILEIDHIGPFKTTQKKELYILSIIDLFTKKKWYFSTNSTTAEETYDLLIKNIITPFGIPRSLLTDQGSEFNNALSASLSSLFGISHSFATTNPRHEATGAVERSNRTCEDMLRKYVNRFTQEDWPNYLHLLAFAENQAISRSHSFQPDYLMFGREPRRLIDLDQQNSSLTPVDQHIPEFTTNLKQAWKIAAQVLEDYQNQMINKRKEELGRRIPIAFKPGDLVWRQLPSNAIIKDNATKLHPKALGPYKILEILENDNVKIEITPTITEIVRPNQLRLVKDQQYPFDPIELRGKSNEIIIISKPSPPPKKEKEVPLNDNLNINTIIGRRIKIYWPSNKAWYPCTVIGYNATKSANLVYYDERTADVNPQEDFYQAPLFKTTNKNKIDTWKLLETTEA